MKSIFDYDYETFYNLITLYEQRIRVNTDWSKEPQIILALSSYQIANWLRESVCVFLDNFATLHDPQLRDYEVKMISETVTDPKGNLEPLYFPRSNADTNWFANLLVFPFPTLNVMLATLMKPAFESMIPIIVTETSVSIFNHYERYLVADYYLRHAS